MFRWRLVSLLQEGQLVAHGRIVAQRRGIHSSTRSSASEERPGTSRLYLLLAGLCGLTTAGFLVPGKAVRAEGQEAVGHERAGQRMIEAREVTAHSTESSAWVVIDGKVYDVTKFLEAHPGGAAEIVPHLGKDITKLFTLLHPKGTFAAFRSSLVPVGALSPSTALAEAPTSHAEAEQRRKRLPPLESVASLKEFEELAAEVLGKESASWWYIQSGADDGHALRANSDSFNFLRFLPRVATSVRGVALSTSILGVPSKAPFFIAPTGQNRNSHPDGELNYLEAAGKAGIPLGLSNAASVSILEISEAREEMEAAPALFWQLYMRTKREESEAHLQVAVKAGAKVIFWTVDTPALGNRDRPRHLRGNGGGTGVTPEYFSRIFDADLSWQDIDWIKARAPGLPVVVKGVASVEDVALAKRNGAAGVVLSNHGGRQLDGAPPPLATLVRLRKEAPELLDDPSFAVFIDGGVSRGSDIVKALCLGARAVGIGRAFIHAQTTYGAVGVVRAFLEFELLNTMALLGVKTIQELRPSMVELLPGLVGERL